MRQVDLLKQIINFVCDDFWCLIDRLDRLVFDAAILQQSLCFNLKIEEFGNAHSLKLTQIVSFVLRKRVKDNLQLIGFVKDGTTTQIIELRI